MKNIKEPKNLSVRVKRLRDFYFEGVNREWNNEFKCFAVGTPYDTLYNELTFYIVPETYSFFSTFCEGIRQSAERVGVPKGFFDLSIAERRAWLNKEIIVNKVPCEMLEDDLLCGANFNIISSMCLNRKETKTRDSLVVGKGGTRGKIFEFHDRGFGNAGATSGHFIPNYPFILQNGFKAVYEDLKHKHSVATDKKKKAQLSAMMTASLMPKELAEKYSAKCLELAEKEKDFKRKDELTKMANILKRVPWNPAENFWEAVQSLWITHMLVMSDENYPGPGVSFGRLDQYLFPFYQKSVEEGMSKEFMKEILGCLWFHCNTAYDAMIKLGCNQGITAGYGQLFMIGGLSKDFKDATNELSYLLLEVIDEMSPILEPKPNVRLHKNSPEKLLDIVIDMISESQGAPFLLNFDERSMAGMMNQAKKAGLEHLINEENVADYASVGCLENSMAGNDRSGTVDININLLKALELTLGNGSDIIEYKDQVWGKVYPKINYSGKTGEPEAFKTFDDFYNAFKKQTAFIIKNIVDMYNITDTVRATFQPTPYVSCLVKGCAESGKDVTEGGGEIRFVTIEGVTFASTVDSLLAVKHLVFDKKECTMSELITALKANWEGYEVLQAKAKNKAPKYGRDDDDADALAEDFMRFWTDEVWKHRTVTSDIRFRPGMLSWNYWVGDGFILSASPDGRKKGQFLSNAICPVTGADIKGPTSNVNSVGKALGGHSDKGGFMGYINHLPNGASHTITLSPALVKSKEHKEKLKAFICAYAENGGTALQLNILDAETLIDAQKNPSDYRHLLVRITGYNAYFTAIGKELQDEIIARESHSNF
ncbi:MAG: hypothetical protein FWD49_07420 [Firmicutes bacterium]|nr:hypothetical protein [Bacillota bacterium]